MVAVIGVLLQTDLALRKRRTTKPAIPVPSSHSAGGAGTAAVAPPKKASVGLQTLERGPERFRDERWLFDEPDEPDEPDDGSPLSPQPRFRPWTRAEKKLGPSAEFLARST